MSFVTRKVGETEFNFGQPNVGQLDRYLRVAQKGITSASISLAAESVDPAQRDEWTTLVGKQPGQAVQAANAMLQQLGYADTDIAD